MSINKIKTLLFLFLISVIFTSCGKEEATIEPDRNHLDSAGMIGFKDSSLLIKSVSKFMIGYSGEYLDSSTFYVYYDSLNRKINFNSEYTSSSNPTDFSTVHTYNTDGLLIQLDRHDAKGNFTNIYNYDAQNIIRSATIELEGGLKKTVNFTKKLLPEGGYSLSVIDSTNYSDQRKVDFYAFDFNEKGDLIIMRRFYNPDQRYGFMDSIFYDAHGNVSKVVETLYPSGAQPLMYTLFEFSERATQGDQYYTFNKKVYNGIAGFPSFLDNFVAGSPLTGLYNEDLYQFSKCPALSNRIFIDYVDGDEVYLTFKPEAEFDSKNRLSKFKSYIGRQSRHSAEYRLTYYK